MSDINTKNFVDLNIDYGLFYLEQVLFSLDDYNFDSDIIKILNDLKTLVDKKLYSKLNLFDNNISNQELFIRFYLNK